MSLDESTPLLGDDSTGEQRKSGFGGIFFTGVSSKFRRTVSGCSILFTLTLERIAFYSLICNLYLYLNRHPFNWMSYNAMTASYVFTGVAFLTAIFGGWLADSILGKFYTLIIGLLLYALGYSGMVYIAHSGHEISPLCLLWPNEIPVTNETQNITLPHIRGLGILDYKLNSNIRIPVDYLSDEINEPISFEPRAETCAWTIYIVLIIIAFAVGIIRANIAPFGADQFKNTGDESMRRFFNYYYWCVNIGAFFALGAISYIQQTLSDGFFIGYLIPAIAIGFAIVIFVFCRIWYIDRKPAGSVLINVMKIVREAWRSKKMHRVRMERQRSLHIDLPSPSDNNLFVPSCLDLAKVRYGGSFHESAVEDVKSLGKIFIIFSALIPYWVVYFQMQTSFIAQGLHMKLNPYAPHIQNKSDIPSVDDTFTIPAAWLTLFDVTFLLILIPLMDRVVYPYLDKKQIVLSPLFKISLGMIFALIAVFLAGGLEYYRLDYIHKNNDSLIIQVVGNTSYIAADITIFWQVPQYALIGISEVFASIASLEFAYSQAPKSMQGTIMGVHSLCSGIGSFLGTGLLEAVRPYWFTNHDYGSLNESNLDYYFFLLGGIQLFTIIIFISLAKRFNLVNRTSRVQSIEVSSTQDIISNAQSHSDVLR